MGMSKQMTFTLACAVVLSALGPGVAGYLSARLEAIEAAESNLRALEARLNVREARDARPASYRAPCVRTPGEEQTPTTEQGERWLHDVPGWLAGPSRDLSDAVRSGRN